MDPTSEPIKPLSTYTPQTDSSKYIRTYAKDLAAVSGQPVPTTPLPKPAQTDAQIASEAGVALPEYDMSPVNRSEPASPKEFPQEVVDLKESDSEDIFAGGSIPNATNIPTLTPPADADREAVLARLRAKVSASRAVEATAPPPAPLPIRTAAPDFSSIPEPVLPIPQVTKEPFVSQSPSPPPEVPSPLHTYSSDFADHIDTAGGTAFSVLAAQSDAGQTPRPTPRKRNFAPLFAGGAMLVIGIGAIVGAYLFTRHGSGVILTNVPSLIPFDESVEVKGSGQTLMQAIANIGQGGSVSGNVIVTYVTLATSTGSGIPEPGGTLIKELNLSAPSILLRNIDDSSTVGVVRAGSESRPFIILKVNSYERTFAGMLAWEPTMANDLATFYPSYADAQPVSSGTASTTTPVSNPTSFSDAVIANYDVRVLRDRAARSLLLYGYSGKDTLIIARDEAAFTALISRLSAARN